jgi:hypothetical protein
MRRRRRFAGGEDSVDAGACLPGHDGASADLAAESLASSTLGTRPQPTAARSQFTRKRPWPSVTDDELELLRPPAIGDHVPKRLRRAREGAAIRGGVEELSGRRASAAPKRASEATALARRRTRRRRRLRKRRRDGEEQRPRTATTAFAPAKEAPISK